MVVQITFHITRGKNNNKTRRFDADITSIHRPPPKPNSLKSALTQSSHQRLGLPLGCLPVGIVHPFRESFVISRTILQAHFILHNVITSIISTGHSSALGSCLNSPVALSFFGPKILRILPQRNPPSDLYTEFF